MLFTEMAAFERLVSDFVTALYRTAWAEITRARIAVGSTSKAVLPQLYVVDGVVIPGALAANPSLTISAQALKTMKAALA